jgi:DNA-binding GntR family transcriptional regulator
MPVRDALALLEQDGLVETAARRWTRVVELSPALVEELVPLVSLLDQYAISSAPVVSKEALDRLRIANETFAGRDCQRRCDRLHPCRYRVPRRTRRTRRQPFTRACTS